jgi:hypothetical protein
MHEQIIASFYAAFAARHSETMNVCYHKDGKIIKHTDSFDLRKWAAQAMGLQGGLLGGTGLFRKKLQGQTNQLLDELIEP